MVRWLLQNLGRPVDDVCDAHGLQHLLQQLPHLKRYLYQHDVDGVDGVDGVADVALRWYRMVRLLIQSLDRPVDDICDAGVPQRLLQ
jgi:hypothetical protein